MMMELVVLGLILALTPALLRVARIIEASATYARRAINIMPPPTLKTSLLLKKPPVRVQPVWVATTSRVKVLGQPLSSQ